MMENGGLGMPLDKTLPAAVFERVYFVNRAKERLFCLLKILLLIRDSNYDVRLAEFIMCLMRSGNKGRSLAAVKREKSNPPRTVMPARSLLKQALTSKERQGTYGVNRAQYLHWESPHGFLLADNKHFAPGRNRGDQGKRPATFRNRLPRKY
jgi:hypothetical protein